MKSTPIRHEDGHLDICMNQPADTVELIEKASLSGPQTIEAPTPYCSNFPIDNVSHVDMSDHERQKLNKILQEYVGSLKWLATQTRPDKSTITTNIIAQYNSNCSPGHIEAAKYVSQYLKGTADLGIKSAVKTMNTLNPLSNFH